MHYFSVISVALIASFLSLQVQAQADPAQAQVKVTQILKTTKEWDGSPLPPYPSQNPEITILSYEIPAGVRLPVHRHPVINAGVVMQGNLTVISESGKELVLKQGDSIVELVNQWHYGENKGSEPVKLIMFYVGEVGVPLVVKQE
ncbi:Cupin domain protein [Polynucleobacter meluiroseus]|uniref:Cupin domain protein n=1 Tax=Polynucleobacter meluiroseus TaxID=1938814 RepID=A0A240E1V3_9BURK|nr:cupin domain-containing protein [Polynucleobacter meluiroseus]SNX29192.1 Cupin domain protein [Polynucleobacter meluiroseus]